jgi:hypothetical protein
MYFRSLNEILVSLVCIMSIVRFQFQIQTLFFIQTKPFDTYTGTPISCIQVCPTKSTFVKIKSRYNFGEFSEFFLQGLCPFKIHRRFKFESVPEFIT